MSRNERWMWLVIGLLSLAGAGYILLNVLVLVDCQRKGGRFGRDLLNRPFCAEPSP